MDGRARRGRVGGHGLDGERCVPREGDVPLAGDRLLESKARRREEQRERGDEAVRVRAQEGLVARIEAQRHNLMAGGAGEGKRGGKGQRGRVQ